MTRNSISLRNITRRFSHTLQNGGDKLFIRKYCKQNHNKNNTSVFSNFWLVPISFVLGILPCYLYDLSMKGRRKTLEKIADNYRY